MQASLAFYRDLLGMTEETFGEGRTAVSFGANKINLHDAAAPVEPHALRPSPGSGDLCLIVDGPLDRVAAELADADLVELSVYR